MVCAPGDFPRLYLLPPKLQPGRRAVTAARRLVEQHTEGNWSAIARELNVLMGTSEAQGRAGKQ